MITALGDPSETNDLKDSRRPGHRLIPVELADPKCLLCDHLIQKVNEIFEQDDTPCPDPREYCMTHLLEALHSSLIWRLSKQ